ncbi:hypothetical protein JMJ35_004395 [Cladonia borealis]|uniref:TPR-like protein n=1 Tax=Cladonia borealis TaxID=184061 RepID=A0AA39R4B7_9LECA|nr:hypothetical protein JMJ35_004395 [Cladonia borealis]
MASPLPSEGSSAPKRHSRNISINRTSMPRRLTKGPLEVEDPLATASQPTQEAVTTEASEVPIPTTPFSPERSSAVPVAAPTQLPPKDFSYLLRPEIYHPLSHLDLPPPFRTPVHQPPPSTPLPTLLSNHNFRSAATASALRLCAPPPPPTTEIFSLFYTRLACLTLINHLPFAAEESKALQDINSPFYLDDTTKQNILPWELRILVIRLQGIGYSDEKRSVGGYYELAREARALIKTSTNPEETELWKTRLKDLGIYVANALIEIGDLPAAARHLETLTPRSPTLLSRLALTYIALGDLSAAQHTLSSLPSPSPLTPLLTISLGNYPLAITELRALPPSDLVTQNLAVCLFYIGRVDESVKLLEGLVDQGRSFHALTFNLATVFELCCERGRERKGELVGRVERVRGVGERGGGDFKL